MNGLSDRIKEVVKNTGKTQRAIAEEIGITEVTLSRYISGSRSPRTGIIEKLAKACNVSADWLAFGSVSPHKHVEMIIDYTVDGNDFLYNGNHGSLVRCYQCKYWKCNTDQCAINAGMWTQNDYCRKAERREDW